MSGTPEGRVPPHNIEAEQASLGAILLNPKDLIMDEVFSRLQASDFYRSAHQKIYIAIQKLAARSEAIDLITLTDELQSQKLLESVGGASYISTLTSIVPTSSNVLYYVGIVKQTSMRRILLRMAADISDEAFDESQEVGKVIDEAERRIFDITNDQVSRGFKLIKEVVPSVVDTIETRYNNPGVLTGVPTGFSELDDMTDGFQNSEFIIIGARPSIGKTALALSIARNICLRGEKRHPTGFFSLEMAEMQLVQRLLAMETHIPGNYLRRGRFKAADLHNLMDIMSEVYEAPLYISDTPNMRLLDLKAESRRMKSFHDVEIIFIDYLSIITPENDMKDRHIQVAEVSRSLKSLARELNIPVVALSQVSRDTEGKEPHLASIRESGAIEQDADLVIFLHRDRTHDNEVQAVETQLIVSKNRNGPVGRLDVNFLPPYAEFVPLDPHEH